MDIATAANFPCQRPFSEHLGVAELPQYRILPDHKQTAASSNGWQASETGGPFLFTQALLRTSTISTYLRGDWYRDWGSVEQYFPLVPSRSGAERRHRTGCEHRARLEPARTDSGAAMSQPTKDTQQPPPTATCG